MALHVPEYCTFNMACEFSSFVRNRIAPEAIVAVLSCHCMSTFVHSVWL